MEKLQRIIYNKRIGEDGETYELQIVGNDGEWATTRTYFVKEDRKSTWVCDEILWDIQRNLELGYKIDEFHLIKKH